MACPTAIVLVAHGSPDPEWRQPLEAAAEAARARLAARPEPPQVVLAYLGACAPSLPEAMAQLHAQGHRAVRVVAAFLSPGGRHIKTDLPQLVQQQRERWPELRLELQAGALGAEPEVIDAMAAAVTRIAVDPPHEAAQPPAADPSGGTARRQPNATPTREELHAANRQRWEAAAAGWSNKIDAQALWRVAHREPDRVLAPIERELLGDLTGRRVAVLGSGDNLHAFALAGLGAAVTSVDIAQGQLDVAAERARANGLSIDFLRADVCDLSALADESFDIVYTGGHVAVWVSDLQRFYAEAVRILRPEGLLLVDEYHPMRRIWRDTDQGLHVEHGYFDRGPHSYPCSPDLFDRTPGELVQHEFSWTIADYLHAITRAGARLVRFEEHGDEPQGWEGPPLGGLPHAMLIAARKDASAAPL